MSIIKRQILYPGKRDLGELEPETKLVYHFETVVMRAKDSSEPLVIDDSRKMSGGKPVETIYGKQFKLPIWESCLSSMRKGEICKLTVRDDPITHYICLNYVITSKCFRKYYGVQATTNATTKSTSTSTTTTTTSKENKHARHPHHHSSTSSSSSSSSSSSMTSEQQNHTHQQHHSTHNCSMSLRDSPYKDLNELISNPPEIFEFTFELIDAIPPKCYTKDIWQMSDSEKMSMLPKYREDGNKYYNECDYEKATSFYMKGLNALESLMLKEKPGESDWLKLDELKKPFLLNLAQVKLNQGEHYECIKYSDEVLKRDPENIKALFRRAKAHAAVWNIQDARDDLRKCVEFDRSMSKTVAKCYQELKQREEIKNKEDRQKFGNMFNK